MPMMTGNAEMPFSLPLLDDRNGHKVDASFSADNIVVRETNVIRATFIPPSDLGGYSPFIYYAWGGSTNRLICLNWAGERIYALDLSSMRLTSIAELQRYDDTTFYLSLIHI